MLKWFRRPAGDRSNWGGPFSHSLRAICTERARTAGSSRSFTALRKDAGLYCGSRLLEGRSVCLCWAKSKPKGPKGPRGGARPRRRFWGSLPHRVLKIGDHICTTKSKNAIQTWFQIFEALRGTSRTFRLVLRSRGFWAQIREIEVSCRLVLRRAHKI